MEIKGTLSHVVRLLESAEVATTVAATTRFLLSLHCAGMEEMTKRIERRGGGEGDQA